MFSTDLKELYIRSGGNCYRLLNAADDLWTPKQGVTIMKSVTKALVAVSLVILCPSAALADSANQPIWFQRCGMDMPHTSPGAPWWTDVPCWAATLF